MKFGYTVILVVFAILIVMGGCTVSVLEWHH